MSTNSGFAKRRDKNEPEIVDALEAVGASVTRLNQLAVPDLLVGYKGRTLLMEVKSDKGKLNENQVKWFDAWLGAPPAVVRSPEEALAALGLLVVSPGMYTYCPEHEERCQGHERCCCKDKHTVGTYPRSK